MIKFRYFSTFYYHSARSDSDHVRVRDADAVYLQQLQSVAGLLPTPGDLLQRSLQNQASIQLQRYTAAIYNIAQQPTGGASRLEKLQTARGVSGICFNI